MKKASEIMQLWPALENAMLHQNRALYASEKMRVHSLGKAEKADGIDMYTGGEEREACIKDDSAMELVTADNLPMEECPGCVVGHETGERVQW